MSTKEDRAIAREVAQGRKDLAKLRRDLKNRDEELWYRGRVQQIREKMEADQDAKENK